MCVEKIFNQNYFTLEFLNRKIVSFQYKYTDKVDRPQPIPKTFTVKKTIGGNGHENAALLRLLPLIIGYKVPEEDLSTDGAHGFFFFLQMNPSSICK